MIFEIKLYSNNIYIIKNIYIYKKKKKKKKNTLIYKFFFF